VEDSERPSGEGGSHRRVVRPGMTAGVTVALVGALDVAKELGKKGTQSDITLYDRFSDDQILTVVEPSQYPEKISSLLFALEMSDRIEVVVKAIQKEIAETLAVVEIFDKPTEFLLAPAVGEAEFRRLMANTRLSQAPCRLLDFNQLRAEALEWRSTPREGPALVRLDHAFPVKGVGAVALGLVRQGQINAHDRLRLYPTERQVEIRSIQVHDVDVPSASSGTRVGLALRGVDADELARGQTLAADGVLKTATTFPNWALQRSAFYRGALGSGRQAQLMAGLQLVPTTVTSVESARVTFESDRPVGYLPGDTMLLVDLEASKGSRVVGTVQPVGS
jgi:selenocysteine-specific translation elongation factor